jgi:hypothetical protein
MQSKAQDIQWEASDHSSFLVAVVDIPPALSLAGLHLVVFACFVLHQ